MRKQLLTFFIALTSLVGWAQYPTVDIDSIQYRNPQELANCLDSSSYAGDTVVLHGFVVVDGVENAFSPVNGGFLGSGQTWIMMDTIPFGGIDIWGDDLSDAMIENLVAGMEVEMTGYIEEYQGETEFVPLPDTWGTAVTVLSAGNPIHAKHIDVADLNDQNQVNNIVDGEQWEGMFVEINDVIVETVSFFSGGSRVSFVVKDALGNKVNIGDRFMAQRMAAQGGTFVAPNVGDQFNSIKGIVIHSKNGCSGTGRGYEIHPFDSLHYDYGAAAPIISNVTRTPQVPTDAQSVTISADIEDIDGVLVNTDLHYAVGATNPTFTTVPMTNTVGSTYEGTIPAQPDGSFVKYYVSAEDDSSLVTTVPNADPNLGTYFYTVRNNGLTIYDVQYTPFSDGNSGYRFDTVTVTGVVTASAEPNNLGYVYIQQENETEWAGIFVTGNPLLSQLSVGDKVTVSGEVEEYFGFTRIDDVTNVVPSGAGTITPEFLTPYYFDEYNFNTNEKYEGMLIGLIDSLGGKVWVVDENADDPNNYAEYRVGLDTAVADSGCRVLAGRQTSSAFSSLNVSYVNDTIWATDAGVMNAIPVVVNDSVRMDTLCGVLTYSFGSFKLLPRNNDDFKGINVIAPSVGVDEMIQENARIEVFPNPASDDVNIHWNANGISTVRLFDMSGKEMIRSTTMSNNIIWNTNDLHAGVYVVYITGEQDEVIGTSRLVVTH